LYNDIKKRISEILLVEDNPDDVLLITEAFKENNVRTHLNTVGDGEEALNYLNQTGKYTGAAAPDFIILDLNLPRMDGRDFLRRIKEENLFKSIPIIVLTSSRSDLDIREVWALNANCYIVKPLDMDGYIETVKKIRDFWTTVVALPSKPVAVA
jgi:two-component system, chemotaxis family, response regulator Rcp1